MVFVYLCLLPVGTNTVLANLVPLLLLLPIVTFELYYHKKWPKMTKILSVMFHISGTMHHIIVIYGTFV